MSAHLRITAWPGGVLPVPPVIWSPVQLDGEWLNVDWSKTSYAHDLAPELYLRDALDVDLADAAAVAEFVQQHGRFAPVHDLDEDLPGLTDAQRQRPRMRGAAEFGRTYARDGHAINRFHVDEVTYRIRVLRRLAAHAVAFRAGDYVHPAWAGVGPTNKSRPVEDQETSAWQHFTESANPALRRFHLRISVDRGGPDYDIGIARPTAYEAAVLQLVNDLIEEVDYRNCAHCGRVFARQIGRSEHYSRSSGVMYCTPSCARAAGVKAYRARKRAEREGKS